MSGAAYHLRQALGCLRQSPWASAVAAATVAAALSVSGTAWLLLQAVQAALQNGVTRAPVTVFLAAPPAAGTTGEQLAAEAARAAGPGARASYVDPADALRRLRTELGEQGAALDSLGANPLPPSIDVRLPEHLLAQDGLRQLRAAAARLQQLPFAAEVDYGRDFVERLEQLLAGARAGGALLFALVLGVALFLVGNVVRLTVYARRDEIDILRLVGATDVFIAVPFLAEGALQGLAGGALGALLVLLVERMALPAAAGLVGFGGQLLPPPHGPGLYAALVAGGLVAGLAASALAVARFLGRLR